MLFLVYGLPLGFLEKTTMAKRSKAKPPAKSDDPRKAELDPKVGAIVTVYYRGTPRRRLEGHGEVIKVRESGCLDVTMVLPNGSDYDLRNLARCNDPNHFPSWDAPSDPTVKSIVKKKTAKKPKPVGPAPVAPEAKPAEPRSFP